MEEEIGAAPGRPYQERTLAAEPSGTCLSMAGIPTTVRQVMNCSLKTSWSTHMHMWRRSRPTWECERRRVSVGQGVGGGGCERRRCEWGGREGVGGVNGVGVRVVRVGGQGVKWERICVVGPAALRILVVW